MEQVVLGGVSVVIIVCATVLGLHGKLNGETVLTSVASGLFGYAGKAHVSKSTNIQEDSTYRTKEEE